MYKRQVQRVQVLALVLVHALDLAVEDGIGVDHLAGGLFQIGGELGLVGLLHVLQKMCIRDRFRKDDFKVPETEWSPTE